MGARNTGTRVDDSAIASNCLRQGLGPVERGAELAEDFDAAGVCDRVFALNPVPQGGSMGTERPGRGNPGRFTWNDGKRRFCHISCPVFPMSTTNGLRRKCFDPNAGLVTFERRHCRARWPAYRLIFSGPPPRLVIDIKRKFTQVMCKIFLERPTIFINDISTLLVGFGALPPAPARDAGGAARCASAVGQYPGVPGDFFCVKTAAPPAPFVLPRGASEKPTTSRPSGRGRSWSALRNCCGSSPEAAMVTRNTAS